MKIDPENYDLRELRRIADERRTDRNGRASTEAAASDDDEADNRRPRREGPPNRSGRNDRDRTRQNRDEARRNGERRRRNRDGRGRGRPDRSGELSRPRRGYSDHGDAQDEVVKADRLASELGLDRAFGDVARDGRAENGRGRPHSGGRDGRRRDDGRRDDAEYYDDGYDGYDDYGREYDSRDEYDEFGYAEEDAYGREAEPDYETRNDDHPEDVGRFRFDNEVHERPRGRAGEVLRQNQLEQLLVHETAAAGDSLEKPYLRTLPNEYAAERVVFDWLEFMVLKGGFKRTMDALRYYLTVDWITEDVETELHDYLIGFSGNVADTTEFDVDDHHLSLLYVARLTSMT